MLWAIGAQCCSGILVDCAQHGAEWTHRGAKKLRQRLKAAPGSVEPLQVPAARAKPQVLTVRTMVCT